MSWTEDEDNKLVDLVDQFGPNFRKISEFFPDRVTKQIREHWLNQLNPNINKSQLSDTEINYILEFQEKFGNKWAEIARILNRRPNQIKNYWYSTKRKLEFEDYPEKRQKISPNKFQKLVQIGHQLHHLELKDHDNYLDNLDNVFIYIFV